MDSDESFSGSSSSDDPLVNSIPPAFRGDINRIRADYNRFDYHRYPKPLPLLGPLFGFHENRVRKMVVAEWAWARRTLRRPLNLDEEDALAGAACKQMRIMSYAGPIGAMAGFYRAYITRESWRLPFWSMGEGFDPSVVKFGSSRELLRGEAAKAFWRVVRNGLYGANGVVFSMCIFASFSASSVSVAIRKDPRLEEFAQAIKNQAITAREQHMKHARGLPPTRSDPTGQGNRSAGELWNDHRNAIERPRGNYEDASASNGPGQGGDYSYSNQDQSRDFDSSRNEPSSSPTWQSQRGTSPARPQPPQQSHSGAFIDDWDDASPTAAPARSQSGQPYAGSGSAWDRIRRNAADGPNDAATTRDPSAPREDRGANTGYTFSNQDEDRQLAKGEAQKEFDARIERERHGGNFDEGRGQRKW